MKKIFVISIYIFIMSNLITSCFKNALISCVDKTITTFEDRCTTTDDGFTYYYNENISDGISIISIPDQEELIIPEYIDSKKVTQLGYRDIGTGYLKFYSIESNNVKKITINSQIDYLDDLRGGYVKFPNLTNLTFVDFLYCNLSSLEEELIVPHYIGERNSNVPTVELRKTDRKYSLEDFKPKVIIIPEYVKVIEKDVFAGLEDVIIKTSYETKPEGWEEGWNGNCEVIWGNEGK